jgi:ribosome maturation factor RimP
VDLELITQKIKECQDIKYDLDEVKVKKDFGYKVLEISFNGNPSSEDQTSLTKILLDLLDEQIEDDCLLEVSSSGKTFDFKIEDLELHVKEYIYVKTLDGELYGDLTKVDENDITLSFFIKGKPSKKVILKKEITLLRSEVKL